MVKDTINNIGPINDVVIIDNSFSLYDDINPDITPGIPILNHVFF